MSESGLSLMHRPGLARLLGSVGVAAAALFLAGQVLDSYILRMVAKPLPVLCMALYVLLAPGRGRYQIAIIAGLIFSMLGDILLEASARTFLPGVVAFLLAHVAYIVAFRQDSRTPALIWAALAYAYGAVAFALLLASGNLGEMTLPVALYVIVICTMLWRAGARWRSGDVLRLSAQAALLGALLFTLSDTILALNRWAFAIPFARYLNISTYWLGQWGIALSAVWQRGKNSR